MAAKQLINITAAFTPVSATIFSNYVEIQEDGSGSAAGLKVKFPTDNFTAVYEYPPADQPVKIGTPENTGAPGTAPFAGVPEQDAPIATAGATYKANTNPATVYCEVASMGADTVIRVDERP